MAISDAYLREYKGKESSSIMSIGLASFTNAEHARNKGNIAENTTT